VLDGRAGDAASRTPAADRRAEFPVRTTGRVVELRAVDPILLRARSGKTAARVLAFGFGGGTMLIGVASFASEAMRGAHIGGLVLGYGIATLPFFALAGVVALCRSELWLVPEARALRLLTFRPWRLGPRVEEASVSEYTGVRLDPAPVDDGGGVLVSLVAVDGEAVPLRQFPAGGEAVSFAEQLAEAAGLWLRSGLGAAATGDAQDGPPAA
jgi:hypothetical protein